MILITLSEEKNSKVSNKTKKEADRIDLLLFYIFTILIKSSLNQSRLYIPFFCLFAFHALFQPPNIPYAEHTNQRGGDKQ